MIILKTNEHLVMPSGKIATYCTDKQKWEIKHPSLWQDLVDIFTNSPNRYVEVQVGRRIVTVDNKLWFCQDVNTLREAVLHEYV